MLTFSSILMAYIVSSYESDSKEEKKRGKHTHKTESKLMLKQFK